MVNLSLRAMGLRVLLPVALCGIVCCGQSVATSDRGWTLAAHICVDGDLSEPGREYAGSLMKAAEAGGWSLRLQLEGPGEQLIRQAGAAEYGVESQSPTSAGVPTAEAIESLLRWSRESAPAERYALIIYGHDARSIPGRADDLTFREIGERIKSGLGRPIDLLVLERCHGASVEAAWDLRDSVELLVGAPGLRSSAGLRWARIIGEEAPSSGLAPIDIALRCIGGDDSKDGSEMIALWPSRSGGIAEAVGRLAEVGEAEMASIAPLLTGALSQSTAWGADETMVDLRGLCSRLANVTEGELRSAALATVVAVDDCVVTPAGGSGVGPGISFGSDASCREQETETRGGFAEITGWSRLTEAYRGRLHELMNRPSARVRDEAVRRPG